MKLERGKTYFLLGGFGVTRSFGSQFMVTKNAISFVKNVCILNLVDEKDFGAEIQFHYLLNYKAVCPYHITMLYKEAELEKLDLKNFDIILVHGFDFVTEEKSFLSRINKEKVTLFATAGHCLVTEIHCNELKDSFDFTFKIKHIDETDDIILRSTCSEDIRIKGKFYFFDHFDLLD